MRSILLRSALVPAILLSAVAAVPAAAQSQADLKARCEQLTSFYDRYGTSRSENSDGARNHTRIAADIDCKEGNYAEGIAEMEALLKRKNFEVPAAPTGVAQTPSASGAKPAR
jgi:hypothetical protein